MTSVVIVTYPRVKTGSARARVGGDLDLEGLPQKPAGPQRGEAPDLARVVRPGLGARQRGDHGARVGHLDRRVGVPDLLLQRRALGGQLAQLGQLQAERRVVRLTLRHGRKRHPPRAARVVRIRGREPVADQRRRAALQRLAAQHPARGLVRAEALRAERAVERGDVGDAQPARRVRPVPVRGEDAEGEAEVVDVALLDRTPVIRGVEEVGDPGGGVAARDRGAGHPGEAERARLACGLSRSAHAPMIVSPSGHTSRALPQIGCGKLPTCQ